MVEKLSKVTLREVSEERYRSTLVARIEPDGKLVLAGYDIGEYVEQVWGDIDYEYWVRVEAEHKPAILQRLVEASFESEVALRAWLTDQGFGNVAEVPEGMEDTVMLLLMQRQFTNSSGFMHWLATVGVPCDFDSWM